MYSSGGAKGRFIAYANFCHGIAPIAVTHAGQFAMGQILILALALVVLGLALVIFA
jgi:hypothetical protein